LGILQDAAIQQETVKAKVISEYYRHIRKVLSSKLNGYYKALALNAYALPVISYAGGVGLVCVNFLLFIKGFIHVLIKFGSIYQGELVAEVSKVSRTQLSHCPITSGLICSRNHCWKQSKCLDCFLNLLSP